MNKVGSSWWRSIGVTRIKQHIPQQIGVPFTRIGALMLGKSCLLLAIVDSVLTMLIVLVL